jgi:hypothetical protein
MIAKQPCELVPQIGFPLTVPDGPEYETVRSALVARSLDPDDPKHWVLLLRTLVQSQGGRAKRWSTDALLRLMVNVAKLQRERPRLSERGILRILVKRKEYAGISEHTLRRQLAYARDPSRNSLLAEVLAACLERFPGTDRERWINYLSKGVTDYYLDKDGNVVDMEYRGPKPPVDLS